MTVENVYHQTRSNERKFKAHRNKLSLKKFKNQQKEYRRQLNVNESYLLLKENLLTLKSDFLENLKSNEYSWRHFYNMHKNNQLNSVRKFHFESNKHKSVSMWRSILSSIKQFCDKYEINNIHSSGQDEDYEKYINDINNLTKEAIINRKNYINQKMDKSEFRKKDQRVLGSYVRTDYSKIMLSINQALNYVNNLNLE